MLVVLMIVGGLFAALAAAFKLFPYNISLGKIRNLYELVVLLVRLKYHAMTKNGRIWSFVDDFERHVDTRPDVIQFIFVENDQYVSRSALDHQANKMAHWAIEDLHLQQKDTVALMMLNRPEFVALWLGMSKVGVRTALLNTNITGKPFLHSVSVSVQESSRKVVIIDGELRAALTSEVAELQAQGITVLFWDDVSKRVDSFPTTRPDKSHRNQVKESDPFLYIFTSGTTGLPKASKISHTRYYLGSIPFPVVCYLQPGSRMYCCLPLYHSAAGMLGVGAALTSGATLVVRRKFSVRSFTPDLLKYRCQAVQYIGELCRYLSTAPPNPDDSKLSILYAVGNGLRPDVWAKFQERYGVKRVIEFYGATEGNVNMYNSTGKPGALGYMPVVLSELFYPLKIFRVSEEDPTQPLRDATGRCQPANFGEVGLIMNVVNNSVVERRFDGYSDAAASQSKLVHSVLRPGDCYFNSGDLLSRTRDGFYYWSDRVGDTFRWKGENVATSEVAEVLTAVPGFSDVAVYGVSVPGCDGRVGMAAVVLDEGLADSDVDWLAFDRECTAHLPAYARPAFIRLTAAIALTSTFKHQKGGLVKDGYALDSMGGDRLYHYNAREHCVVKMTPELERKINTGEILL